MKEPFKRMRARHQLWKKKYPDRHHKRAPSYTGIANARPATKSISEPPAVLDELPYEVEVSGGYLDLFRWLRDAESELRPMVVKSFEMAKEPEGAGVHLKLRLVAYRAPESRS